ncbi:MAG TPA: iron uptake transporter deferrochelatase/peroxidase subunit [Burkholderiales bacterium]|jgi:deferrochelatase/peroxidase EfeB|nr:iron uptake transporter deferrochelatase/peroxidase subunit [Burkholderiales bacterium]
MSKAKSPGDDSSFRLTRRSLLFGAAAGTLGTALAHNPAAAATLGTAAASPENELVDLSREHAFYGSAEQAGIMTPQQRYALYMTFDLTSNNRSDLQLLLARWSGAIAQLMKGQTIGQVEPKRVGGVGADTGEALNLGPASLTVTVGLGPKVFSDTYGLASKKPPRLRNLKQLPSDALRPELTGGDLSLQACADDPQVTYHAIRDLARIAKDIGVASTRWAVLGFGRASAGKGQVTPRNLLGFRDGTRNIKSADDFDRFVWIKEGPSWQRHGSYQVVRKIQMQIENWDTDRVSDQNDIFGRHKVSGAPLTGHQEFDTPDFHKRDSAGNLVIPPTAHIRLAAHENNGGLKILRRSYNYTDGINRFGLLDAGLLFICYQNDPAHFETLQTRLGASDRLNEYIAHIGSAVFFVPPAPQPGHYIGEQLFT